VLERAMLTGPTNDTISRNIKKDVAVKYPICRNVPTPTGFTSKYYRRKLFKVLEKDSAIDELYAIFEVNRRRLNNGRRSQCLFGCLLSLGPPCGCLVI
jgi:hypothetical protein